LPDGKITQFVSVADWPHSQEQNDFLSRYSLFYWGFRSLKSLTLKQFAALSKLQKKETIVSNRTIFH